MWKFEGLKGQGRKIPKPKQNALGQKNLLTVEVNYHKGQIEPTVTLPS